MRHRSSGKGVLVQGKKVAHGPEECSVALVRGSECTAAAAQHRQQMKLAQGITKSGSTYLIIS